MKWVLSVIVLLMMSCYQKEPNMPKIWVAPEISEILTKIEQEYDFKNESIITLANYIAPSLDNKHTEAICFYNSKIILVQDGKMIAGNCTVPSETRAATFVERSEYYKIIILLHEIGHCQFGLEDDDRLDSDGFPISIMHTTIYSFITSSEIWEAHKDTLLKPIKDAIEASKKK